MTATHPAETIRRAGIYFIPAIAGSIVPLVTLAVVTRVLTREEYGLYALSQVYAVFAAGLVNAGLPSAFERNYFQCADAPARARLLYSTLAFVAVSSVAGGLVTWWAATALSVLVIGAPEYGRLVLATYASVAVFNLRAYYLIWLRNEGRAGDFARFSLDETVLGGVAQMVAVALLGWGVTGLPLGHLAAGVLVLGVVAVRGARELPPALGWAPLRDSLRLALPLTPRILIGTFEGQAGKYVSGQLATVGAAGVYGIGQRIAYGVFTGMTALHGAFGPVVYQRLTSQERGVTRGVGVFLMPFAYASAALALTVILFAEELLWLVVPAGYAGAADVVVLLSAYYAILFFGKIAGPQLLVARWPVLISIVSVLTVALSLTAMVLLTPLWGAAGTALGTLMAGIVMGLVAVYAAQRVKPIDWPWAQCALIFGLVLVAAALVTGLRMVEVTYVVRAAAKLALAVTFIGIGVHLGFVSRHAVQLVAQALRGRASPPPASSAAGAI